jgi:hypothetical protein
MRIKLEVTQQDIDRGKRGECDKCAVALALSRQLPQYEPSVGNLSGITLYDKESRLPIYECDNTKKIQEFISKFDAGEPVKPDTFSLFFKY